MIETKVPRYLFKGFWHAIFILLAVACIAPIILLISISFSDNGEIVRNGYSFWPQNFNLEAYQYILKDSWKIVNAYKITIFVTVVGTVMALLCTILLAYPISRKEFRFRKGVSFAVFFTMLFNGGLVPTYILITRYLNLTDNIWVLILPGLVSPWNVILMKSFFTDIPNEIIEAATIDGASEKKTLFSIVLPISKPALATIGLFIILQYFNDWQGSMLYMNDSSKISLQYFLYKTLNNIQEAQSNTAVFEADRVFPQEPVRMAMAVLVITPVMIVFPFLQKYFVKGITLGSVKG